MLNHNKYKEQYFLKNKKQKQKIINEINVINVINDFLKIIFFHVINVHSNDNYINDFNNFIIKIYIAIIMV